MNKTLALLIRALRTESRDIKSHLFRVGLAILIVLILILGRESMLYESAPGRLMFKWMTIANWIVVTLAGGTFFAIAISEETEQQTLGLLRMANVGPLSLLLGKWLPRMMTAVVLISIQFPFTWLTVTLGGVSWQQIWASYLMLLAHLVLVGNLGLLSSVLNPNSAKACAWTFVAMIIGRLLPVLSWGAIEFGVQKGWASRTLSSNFWEDVVMPLNRCSSSGRLFGEILSTSFKGDAWNSQVISNLVVGAMLFLLAWLIFDPATMRSMSGAPPRASLLTRLFTRKTRISGASWDWALGWKDFRQVGGGWRGILVKFLLYTIFAGSVFYINRLWGSSIENAWTTTGGVMAGFIFWFLLPLELCFLAAKLFRPELNDHTWSTLLTLPKSLHEIAYSKLAGALLGTIPSVFVLSICSVRFIEELLRDVTRYPESLLFIGYGLSVVLLCLHLITFFSVAVDWAAWPIAIVLGVGAGFLVNFFVWIAFTMFMYGTGGGGSNAIMYTWMFMLIGGHCVMTVVTHVGIGLRLAAKGAES